MPKKKSNPKNFPAKWNVFYDNINARQITTFDIFRHNGFKTAVYKMLQECEDKAQFAEQLRKELAYYFRCRSEFEVCVTALFGDADKKIDIYTQVYLNWDAFVDYVWSFKALDENKHKSRCQKPDETSLVHSSWDIVKTGNGCFDYYFVCKHCHKNTPDKVYPVSPDFCPHCGAKMDLA